MKQENLYTFLKEFSNYASGFKIDNFICNCGIQVAIAFSNCVSEDHDTCVHRNKRSTGLRGLLSYRDFTLTSCQKGSHLHINSPILE